MLGAIIGDIVGSRFEWNNIKTKQFDLFHTACTFTDDTVITCAVAKALMLWEKERTHSYEMLSNLVSTTMRELGKAYPHRGYGSNFIQWLHDETIGPYNSCGNGSAMRISPVGWVATSLEECIAISKAITEVTHNHPDGIMGAEATAVQIFLARSGLSLPDLLDYEQKHYYPINYDLTWLREHYQWSSLCDNTCQPAFVCFYESTSFEDCLRNCMSIGGDSDTIGAIAGSIAEAYYGISDEVINIGLSYLDNRLREIYDEFATRYIHT